MDWLKILKIVVNYMFFWQEVCLTLPKILVLLFSKSFASQQQHRRHQALPLLRPLPSVPLEDRYQNFHSTACGVL